jgi:hypothetical protein
LTRARRKAASRSKASGREGSGKSAPGKVSGGRVAGAVLLVASLGWAWLAWWRWLALEQPNYTALGRFLPHWGLWAAMLALAYLLGDGLVALAADGRIRYRWAPRWVLAVLAGWTCWAFAAAVLLNLGHYDAGRHYLIMALAAAAVLASARRWPQWPDANPLVLARTLARSRHPVFSTLLLGASGLCVASYFAEAQLPPTQHDALTYHLKLPRLYAKTGAFADFSHFVAKMPHYPQLLMLPAAQLEDSYREAGRFIDYTERLDHVLPQMNAALLVLMTAALLFRMGRRLGGIEAGALAAALWTMDRAVEFQAPSGYVDIWGGAYLAAGLALLLERREALSRSRESQEDLPGVWALFYGCVGMLFGVKYTYAPYLLPAWLMAVGMGPRLSLKSLRRPAIWLGPMVFAVLIAPWLLKSWRLTGTPLFPFLLGRSTLDPLLIENSRQVTEWLFGLAARDDAWAFLRMPLELGFDTGMPYEKFNINEFSPGPLWVLPLLALLLWRRWRGPRGWLFVTLLGTYGMWFFSAREGRFLIPIYPALFALTASGAVLMIRLAHPSWRRLAAAGLLAFFGFYHYYFLAERSAKLGHHLHLAFTWRQTLTAEAAHRTPAFDLFRRLNREPRRARMPIGMLMDNRTYYLDFPVAFVDSSLERPLWPLMVADKPDFFEASRRFRERGAELLFIHVASLDYFDNLHGAAAPFHEAAIYLRAYMASPAFEKIVEGGGFVVGRSRAEADG